MPVIKLEQELVQSASVHFTRKAVGVELFVKGFASIEGIDRHGEMIPAEAFDVRAFMANPQLWYNHDLFQNEKGMAVPIGIVDSMYCVKAVETGNEQFKLVDTATGNMIDEVANADGYLLKNGDRGLWVVAKVIEPEVIALVEDHRLNAFSWSGALLRRPDGKVARIDIREVSLVFLPANARALFTIGKDMKAGGHTLYAISGSTVFPLTDKISALTLSRVGSRYKFLVRPGGAGHTRVMTPRDEDIDEARAKQIAVDYTKECLQCAVFENTWQLTPDGVQVYKLAHIENGALQNTSTQITQTSNTAGAQSAWPKSYVDSLPKSCFAYVAPDGNRLFPYRDVNGALNPDAVKRAIQDACGSPFYKSALPVLKAAATDLGLQEWLHGEGQSALTAEESRLFGLSAEFPVAEIQTEGGDEEMKDAQEILDAVKGIGTRLDAFDKRIVAIEQTATKAAEADDAEVEDDDAETVVKDVDVSETKKAVKKSKAVDKKVVDVAEFVEASKSDDDEDEDAEEEDDDDTVSLKSAILEGFKTLGSKLNKLEGRLARVEGKPLKSKQLSDEEEATSDEELTPEDFQKMLSKVPKETIKHAETAALDHLLFGDHRARTRAERY